MRKRAFKPRAGNKRTPRRAAVLAAGAAVFSAAVLAAARYRYAQEAYWPASVASLTERYDLPMIIAHKAAGAGAPGNALPAIQEHLKKEIGGLEIDIRLSKDGVPVLFHGDRLEETTACSGPAGSKSREELSACGVPSLEEALRLAAGRKLLILDAKEFTIRDSGHAGALVDLLRRQDAFDSVIVESFNPFFLARMRRLDNRARLSFAFADDAAPEGKEKAAQLDRIPWALKQEPVRWLVREWVRPDYLSPRHNVREATLRRLAGLGYPLIAWTVNEPEEALRLFALGVGGVQTDEPFRLSRAIESARFKRIDDASGLDLTAVADVLRPMKAADIQAAFERARKEGKKVSIAGRRHSMGRHAFGRGHIVIDMTGMRKVRYDAATGLVAAEGGATWLDVQRVLDPRGRAVAVMQSDNIFTVGGSLSVNVHGWQAASAPLSETVEDLSLVLPSGEMRVCSRARDPELFAAVLGGYGAFGVIHEARLRTVPNEMYRKRSWVVKAEDLGPELRARMLENPRARLAYGRLSVDAKHFLSEALINVYEPVQPQPKRLPKMSHEPLARLKWRIFRASERSEAGKARRWFLEKHLGAALDARPVSRNSVMGPDIHVLWPENPKKRDILQEYFLPPKSLDAFLEALREAVPRRRQNLLNVTLRDVRKDDLTVLRYAPDDRIAVVLFFSQDPGLQAEREMAALTQELVEKSLQSGGSFYLPYRPHYTRDQFRRAYPRWRDFARLKKLYDPDGLISSGFLSRLGL